MDALALRAEERRDKLRKAAVRSKYPMTRRYLNQHMRAAEQVAPHVDAALMLLGNGVIEEKRLR